MTILVGTLSSTDLDTTFSVTVNPGGVFTTMGALLEYIGNSTPSGPYSITIKGLQSGVIQNFRLSYAATPPPSGYVPTYYFLGF